MTNIEIKGYLVSFHLIENHEDGAIYKGQLPHEEAIRESFPEKWGEIERRFRRDLQKDLETKGFSGTILDTSLVFPELEEDALYAGILIHLIGSLPDDGTSLIDSCRYLAAKNNLLTASFWKGDGEDISYVSWED